MKKIKAILLLIIFVLSSCVTTTSESGGKAKPGWIGNKPAGNAFYVGIGGSNTGNQANDKEQARSRALAELSSEIYASIQSSLKITNTDSSDSGESYRVEQNIIQKVEQDLEAIETVETYYSLQDGYWYYMRLSRMDWENIQEQRARDMVLRIDEMFSDVFRDDLSELMTIDRAYTEYQNSYTGRKVKMQLFAQEGSIDTLLVMRAEELLKKLEIPALPFPSEMTQMQPLEFSGKIVGSIRNAGAIQLDLLRDDKTRLGQITTDPDGSFEWLYRVAELPGEVNYILKMVSPFSNNDLNKQLEYALPRLSQSARITPLSVNLSFESDMKQDQGLYKRSFDILERMTPFTLTNEKSDKSLKIEFSYHEAPPNDFGLIICYGRTFISLITDSGENILWQSREEKTGGLTVDQAKGKVADKLLELIEADPELQQILREISF
ncbi:MAG: hypothetical protein B6241_07875 [Spirochaetaceae bacterium 4572_59]|nr:MAG: hypothetical protein B6241_07875 [Spirochaetaceae bacterium 4572_59]